MKHIIFTVLIPTVLLLMSACSSNKLIIDQRHHHDKTEDIKQALCIYKKEKGIAEVMAINQHTYQFKFYLGDDIFEINNSDIVSNNELEIGDEFKAVKEIMINEIQRPDCPPVDFHLIP